MLKEKIQNEVFVALKSKDKTRLDVLRFVLSLINYAEIDKKKALTDEEILSLLQKEVKKRQEAIVMFKKGGRTESIEQEEKQINVIQSFLPAQLSKEELQKIIEELIKSSPPNLKMGQIIGQVMSRAKGKADGSVVASIVKQKLSQ